jgi:GntR family transcriptional regulator, carbon starvation induced regulator
MSSVAEMPPTRAEWVDSLLRRAIVHGDLHPGEKLVAERLAEQWGVSATPLRETFQRLAAEGLVVIEPQRGARVAPVSAEHAAEIYEMRLLLDPVAIEQSVRAGRGDPAYADAVLQAHRGMSAGLDAHREFHLVLVSRCPNQRMLAQITQLLEQSQRYQMLGLVAGKAHAAAADHRELRDAAVQGQATVAARVLRRHLQGTLDAVRAQA